MRISRFVARDLRALKARDDSFIGWGGNVDRVLCLRGQNGAGKTTYLDAIEALWSLLRVWSQHRKYRPLPEGHLLARAGLCALLLRDHPVVGSVWLVHGDTAQWEKVELGPDRDIPVIGVLRTGKSGKPRLRVDPGNAMLEALALSITAQERPFMQNPPPPPLPNMVSLGAEERFIRPLRGKDEDLTELEVERAFYWSYRYQATERKRGHIENQMAELLAVNPDGFAVVSQRIRQVLPGVELLNRAEPRSRRPLVRLPSGDEVTLDLLSAGERAALISLFAIQRWLHRGGIVLLDEAELHQHVVLVQLNLSILEDLVVKQWEGQLLVASHSPEVWGHFRSKQIIDLVRDAS